MQQTKTYRKYKENSKERFVRYSEGAEMYHVSVSELRNLWQVFGNISYSRWWLLQVGDDVYGKSTKANNKGISAFW